MLIINADDFGKNRLSTDRILSCHLSKRINSTSVMVFMEDSERAAMLAVENGLRTGLHLNFTALFDGYSADKAVVNSLLKTSSFLGKNKYYSIIYNPFLRKDFKRLVRAQYDEYLRLFKNKPGHFDGHQHMHLCTNMLLNNQIGKASNVRRNFTFNANEKNLINRLYRYMVDRYLRQHYRITDYFFSLYPFDSDDRIQNIINLARRYNVELMVHPELSAEYDFLMSSKFWRLISDIETGG